MMLSIDLNSAVPLFEQLRLQLRDLVSSGELAPGTRLPTVRRLAEDLSLAPNTVARAYRELETSGVIETRGRHGSFVSSHGDPTQRQAQEAAAAYAERIGELGMPLAEAVEFAASALRSLPSR